MRKLPLLFFLSLLFTCGTGSSWAQETDNTEIPTEFSLEEARQYAIKNSYTLQNAQLDILAAEEKIKETRAMGLPQVSATGSYSYMLTVPDELEQFSSFGELPLFMYSVSETLNGLTGGQFPTMPYPGDPEEMNTDDMKETITLDLTVSQLIFSGSYIVALKATKVYKQISTLAEEQSEIAVKEAVTNAYFGILIAEENKAILDSTYTNIEKTLHDIEAMYEEGFVEDTDVDQLRLTAQNIENAINMLERQTQLAYQLLKFEMGVPVEQDITLTQNLNELLGAYNFNQLMSEEFVVTENINYRLLQNQQDAMELNLKLAQSEYLPTVAAFYQHQENFNENSFSLTPPDIIGVSVEIPIFSSGERRAKVSQARIEIEKTEISRQQAVQGLLLQYQQAQTAYQTAFDQYQNEKENMELAQKIYDKTLIKYKEGISSSMDLTQAQNQFLQTQSNYYTAMLELLNAKSALEKILEK